MTKEFNNLEELEPYYDKEANGYVFIKDGQFIDVIKLNFPLYVMGNIIAKDIIGKNINALHIHAGNIKAKNIRCWMIESGNIEAEDICAWDINAYNIAANNIHSWDINAANLHVRNIDCFGSINAEYINYFAFCIATGDIKCKILESRRENYIAKSLDGNIVVDANKTKKGRK